jgi:hypothetical protein
MVRGLALLAVLALAACEPGTDPRDAGGTDAADAPAFGGRAEVRVPREPLDGAGLEVRRFVVSVAELRLVSDRGEGFDPVRTDIGTIDLATPQTLSLAPLAPASYSAVVLRLAGSPTSVELEVDDPDVGLVRVRYDGPLEWMARCSEGVAVGVGEQLDIGISLELDGPWEDLRDAELPEPIEGRVEIDGGSAPELGRRLVLAIGAALRAECGTPSR